MEINELRKENQTLRTTVQGLKSMSKDEAIDLASLDEKHSLTIEYTEIYNRRSIDRSETVSRTWAEIFAALAPDLLENPNDTLVNFNLGAWIYSHLHSRSKSHVKLSHEDFQTLKIQLIALKLIEVSYAPATKGGMALFWKLTPNGRKLMLQLRTIKPASEEPVPPA